MACHQPIEHYIDIDTSHLGGTDIDLNPFHNNDDYELQKQRLHHNKCCLGKKHNHKPTIQVPEEPNQCYSGNQNIDPSVSYINPDAIYIDESSSHQNCCSIPEFNPEEDFRPGFNPQEENIIVDIRLSDSFQQTPPESPSESPPESPSESPPESPSESPPESPSESPEEE